MESNNYQQTSQYNYYNHNIIHSRKITNKPKINQTQKYPNNGKNITAR